MTVNIRIPRTVWDLPREDYFVGGHNLCAGCTAGTIVRNLLKVAGPNTIVVNATGCLEVSTSLFPFTSWKVPWIHIAFENAAAVASGVEAAIKVLKEKGKIDPNKKINIIAIGGDGGTFDIGLQALSGMLERGHNVLYVVYDNEAYMNTGIQRSGATPYKAWTTTTPVIGKREAKKDVAKIMIAHGAKYVATASVGFHQDFIAKIKKASSISGFRFIQLHLPCPVGWRFDSEKTVEVAKLAVETGAWILYEYQDGKLRLTGPSAQLIEESRRKPLEEYLSLQGRFSHLTKEDIEQIKQLIKEQWEWIKKMI